MSRIAIRPSARNPGHIRQVARPRVQTKLSILALVISEFEIQSAPHEVRAEVHVGWRAGAGAAAIQTRSGSRAPVISSRPQPSIVLMLV